MGFMRGRNYEKSPHSTPSITSSSALTTCLQYSALIWPFLSASFLPIVALDLYGSPGDGISLANRTLFDGAKGSSSVSRIISGPVIQQDCNIKHVLINGVENLSLVSRERLKTSIY